MKKKNLKRHTRSCHSESAEAWMIMWKEPKPNLMKHPKLNLAMTPKTTGRTMIWCKSCFSEGKKEEDCRMMKMNLKRHSASKKHANEAFFTSWPGRSCRTPTNIRDFVRGMKGTFPASISDSGVKNESLYSLVNNSTSMSIINPESFGAPIAKDIDLAPQRVSPDSQFDSSAVSVKVEPKQSKLALPVLSKFPVSQQFSSITEKKQNQNQRIAHPESSWQIESKSSEYLEQNLNSRKRQRNLSIFEAFGEIGQLDRAVQNVRVAFLENSNQLGNAERTEISEIIDEFKDILNNLKTLRTAFQQITREKRIRLSEILEITKNLSGIKADKEVLVNQLKVEKEKSKHLSSNPRGSISKKEIALVPAAHLALIMKCLNKYPKLELKNGELNCTCCRDDYSLAGLQTQPQFKISINSRVEFGVVRHMEGKNKRHLICADAKDK